MKSCGRDSAGLAGEDSRARQIMIFLAGDLLAVMSPPHHCSSRRGSHGRIARAGCHKATRMLCGMRSDGLQANVTLYLASPERVDSQGIEDGRRHGSERTCDLHNSPCHHAPTSLGLSSSLATNTHMSECVGDPTGVSVALMNIRLLLYLEEMWSSCKKSTTCAP